MRVEMLAVGKELLIGRTVNSNAHWIGKRMARMGTMLKLITTVDDDLEEIGDAFAAIVRRSPEFLVVVGGLGPTPDDMTLKGIAGAVGVPLRRNGQALDLIRSHYAKRGMAEVELTPARLKMGTLPQGSVPLRNDAGTAPGVRLVVRKTTVFSLPGVPSEMRRIFRDWVEPEIRAKVGKLSRKYVKMKLIGVLESELAPVIEREMKRHPGAYIKSHPRGVREGVSRIELDIAVVSKDADSAEEEGEGISSEMGRSVQAMGGKAERVNEGRS